jgi:hypothetical protein
LYYLFILFFYYKNLPILISEEPLFLTNVFGGDKGRPPAGKIYFFEFE